jgi:two-component system chemotaxis sensor kinase CheA
MLRLGRVVEAGNEGLVRALLGGGVSTRREATAISGRGVGLDVVRTALDRIRGSVDVAWRPGAGTTFTLECPPTPAIVRALLVGIGGQVLAIPSAGVDRLLRVRPDSIRHAEGRPVLIAEGGPYPLVPLAGVLGPPLAVKPLTAASPVVLLVAGDRRLAVTVDELIGEDEVVAQPLGTDEEAHPLVNGGAILPSGRVALVLNVPGLVEGGSRAEGVELPASDGPSLPRRRILVVDDSITTRTLEQSVLEAAGYDVLTAVDGQDAWRRLQELGADLVVADVEMPRMDGFTLCVRIRSTQRFRDLPVVLVTALESEEYRARGLDVGADAYVFKSSFEQDTLLETISDLLGRPD